MTTQRLSIAALALASFAGGAFAQGPVRYFEQVSSYGVTGGIAEIVSASGDGNTLAFSDADAGRIGFVDITDPANPVALPDVLTGGEPTSVSFAGDYVVAAVKTQLAGEDDPAPDPTDPANAGQLFLIDASNPAVPVSLGSVAIGYQPDSVKLVERNGNLVAVVCIENEPIVVDATETILDEDIPGFPTSGAVFPQDRSLPGLVQVVTLDVNDVASSNVANVDLPATILGNAGCLFPNDPQPEFVDIFNNVAAVSLQENNGIAIIRINDPANPQLVRVFSTGFAGERMADLVEDDAISLSQGYPSSIGTTVPAPTDGSGNPVLGGPRQPDAIAFSPNGFSILSADEGELNFTGGRGWSAFSRFGTPVFEETELEEYAVFFGQYPEGRSENRGIECEGITTATFGATDFAFVLSERGSFIAVYEINDIQNPRIVQFLPCGISPEGVVAIPSRSLLVTADEESGTLSIFQGVSSFPVDADRPLLYSADAKPFSAISGLDNAPFGAWGVPDNALPTSIYYVNLAGAGFSPVLDLFPVTVDGVQARYDGEGIVRDDSIIGDGGFFRGFMLASEGNGSSRPNLIVQTSFTGAVTREIQLPASIDAAADPAIGGNAVASAAGTTIRGNGFEGVTLSQDGRYVYACIQREFSGEATTHTRIARYDLEQIDNGSAPSNGIRYGGDWEFFYYPLEAQTTGDWIGLSEIRSVGPGQFIVIERDKGIGTESQLKRVYAFSIAGLTPDTDGEPGEASGNDTVTKTMVVDVVDDFFPFEKIEGLATTGGDLWIGLDNDGGELANRFVNTGAFQNPLGN